MPLFVDIKNDNTGLVDRTENTNRFFKDVCKYETMTREDELKWFGILHNGTKKEKEMAREHIIMCNQRFVISIAKKWANTYNLMDYVNEANIGLIQAIEKFDETKKFKFSTYAIWFIVRAINNYNNKTAPMVRRTNQCKTFHVISKATDKFFQQYHRNPTTEELKNLMNEVYETGIKEECDLLSLNFISIDDDVKTEDSMHAFDDIGEYNSKSSSLNDFEAMSNDEYNKMLTESLLGILKERDQRVIKMAFGLVEVNGIRREFENAEIAEELGLTDERVRQIKADSIIKLKKEYEKRINNLL